MTPHGYTPEVALETLMDALRDRAPLLAAQVQDAIDAGKDTSETDRSGRARRKRRTYRRKVPLDRGEALRVAIDVLQAYFIEQPLLVNSLSVNFADLPISRGKQPTQFHTPDVRPADGVTVAIELQTETQLIKSEEEMRFLKQTPAATIEEQNRNLLTLRGLTSFDEAQ